MAKFVPLTEYISKLQTEDYGEWVIEKRDEKNPEKPIQFPYVLYSEIVNHFRRDFYAFIQEHAEMNFPDFKDILKENGLEWNMDSMISADVSRVDARCILALLLGAFREERFSDGALLELLKGGSVLRWLERLKEIDETEQ